MKTFSCLVFASNPNSDTNKFKPRGIPYVFLGYPATRKGYKLFKLYTKTAFVSRDVCFVEHIFSFHQQLMSVYIQPTPMSMHPIAWIDDISMPISHPLCHYPLPSKSTDNTAQTTPII